MAFGQGWQVVCVAQHFSSVYKVTAHFQDVSTSLTKAQVADEIKNGWLNNFKYGSTNKLTYYQILIRDVKQVGDPFQPFNIGSWQGQIGDYPYPGQVCLCLGLRTGDNRKTRRGRIYVPSIAQGAADMNGAVNINHINLWIGSCQAILNRYSPASHPSGLIYSVYSRKDQTFYGIQEMRLNPYMCIQRRRGPAHGS